MSKQIAYLITIGVIIILWVIHLLVFKKAKRLRSWLSGLIIGLGTAPLFWSWPALAYKLPLERNIEIWPGLIGAGIGIILFVIDWYSSRTQKGN